MSPTKQPEGRKQTVKMQSTTPELPSGKKTTTHKWDCVQFRNWTKWSFSHAFSLQFKICCLLWRQQLRFSQFFWGEKVFPLFVSQRCKMNLLCIVEFHMFYVINSDKLWDEAAFLDGIMAKTTDPIPFALFVALCIAASMFNSTWTCVLCYVCVKQEIRSYSC